jgi:hypothetical protein
MDLAPATGRVESPILRDVEAAVGLVQKSR